MRKAIILASTVLSLSVALPALADHQWVRVTTDNDDNIYYLDKAVAGRGRFRRYWTATYFKYFNGSSKWEKYLYSIDCQVNPMVRRLRFEADYDENNQEIYSQDFAGSRDLEEITSDMTIDLQVANAACSVI